MELILFPILILGFICFLFGAFVFFGTGMIMLDDYLQYRIPKYKKWRDESYLR